VISVIPVLQHLVLDLHTKSFHLSSKLHRRQKSAENKSINANIAKTTWYTNAQTDDTKT